MDRYKVRLSITAAASLERIYRTIRTDSPQNAVLVAKKLWDSIDSLEYFPNRCETYRSHKQLAYLTRRMVVYDYLIYYRVFDNEYLVEIIDVRHGAQKYPPL